MSDPDIPFLHAHLEKILEDSITYPWELIRRWSEEICSRAALGKVRWSDTYAIDRVQISILQSNLSFKDSPKFTHPSKGEAYEMSDEVRRAKPGPPCKFFQTGACSHTSDHVQNGYRQLHVCAYCLSNKCLFQPHSNKDCKTKKFNAQKKGQSEAGFGN